MKARYEPPIYGRVFPPDPAWLALAEPEEVLDPSRPIIDAHTHLWHPKGFPPYLVEDYATDVEQCGHHIAASIFIECNTMYAADGPEHLRPVGETRFAVGQAAMAESGRYTRTRVAAGIVAFADLTLGERTRETLEAHRAVAGARLCGVRQRSKWDADPVVRGPWGNPDPGLYRSPDFARGARLLVEHGLCFDASIYHPELPDVTALARAHPDLQVVLIHMGSPVGHGVYAGREAENFNDWRRDLTDLAACPNAAIKLGGMLMNLANYDFTTAARPVTSAELAALWRPRLETCIELFGAERCMVSSNFPVDKVGFDYRTLWNMFKRVTASCSEHEKDQLFSGTARRIYGLD